MVLMVTYYTMFVQYKFHLCLPVILVQLTFLIIAIVPHCPPAWHALSFQCKVSQLVKMRCSRVTRCPKTLAQYQLMAHFYVTSVLEALPVISTWLSQPYEAGCLPVCKAKGSCHLDLNYFKWVISCSFNLLLTQINRRAIQSTLS